MNENDGMEVLGDEEKNDREINLTSL